MLNVVNFITGRDNPLIIQIWIVQLEQLISNQHTARLSLLVLELRAVKFGGSREMNPNPLLVKEKDLRE